MILNVFFNVENCINNALKLYFECIKNALNMSYRPIRHALESKKNLMMPSPAPAPCPLLAPNRPACPGVERGVPPLVGHVVARRRGERDQPVEGRRLLLHEVGHH